MRISGIAAITALTVLLPPPLSLGATPEVIWEADVVRAISTVEIDVYERQDVALRIPSETAPDATENTPRTRVPEIFRLDLELARRETDEDGFALPVRVVPLGTILVATFLGRDEARTAVRDVVHGFQILSPQTIGFPMPRGESGEPRRWFSYEGSPFFNNPSTLICFEPLEGQAAAELLAGAPFRASDGNIGRSTRDSIEMPSKHTAVCAQLRNALADGSPGEARSGRFALETDGWRTLTVSIHRPATGASAVPLPDGVLMKRTREGTGPEAGESIVSHTTSADFPLSMVRSTSVVMNWVLTRSSNTASDVLEDWVVALYPPMIERSPGDLAPEPAEWEERLAQQTNTEFLEWMRREFKNVTRLNAADVEKILLERLATFLGGEETLVVVCRKDDSATYFTFPTSGRTPVQNAAIFCPELRHALTSSGSE